MQTMQSRSKKGPSWKDEDAIPSAEPLSSKIASKATDVPRAVDPIDVSAEDVAMDETAPDAGDAASDMDWLKRHMKTNLEITEAAQEKVFEQSDDEPEAPAAAVSVRVSLRRTLLMCPSTGIKLTADT